MTRSVFEEELRKRMEKPPPPEPSTHEIEIVSVDEEVEKYPELKRIVQEDREKNQYTESTILHLLPDYEEILGLGLEERVRQNMGLPKSKRKGTEY